MASRLLKVCALLLLVGTLAVATQDEVQTPSGPACTSETCPNTEEGLPSPSEGSGTVARRSRLDLMPFRRMTDSLAQMQREMDALLDWAGMGSDFGGLFGRSPLSILAAPVAPALPRVAGTMSRMVPFEVEEDEAKYSVRAEIPGFTKDDVKVTLDPVSNMLTIQGQKATKEGKQGEARMSFTRAFTLPTDFDKEKQVTARTEHGVLTVELPKAPPSSAPAIKEIPVEGV